jgi:hypothetical protein
MMYPVYDNLTDGSAPTLGTEVFLLRLERLVGDVALQLVLVIYHPTVILLEGRL